MGWSTHEHDQDKQCDGASVVALVELSMAVYALAVLLVLLVIYLFYAVIHPERF